MLSCRRLNATQYVEWWRWPFAAPPFTVPIDNEGYCNMRAYLKLISDMSRLAPPGWNFLNFDGLYIQTDPPPLKGQSCFDAGRSRRRYPGGTEKLSSCVIGFR